MLKYLQIAEFYFLNPTGDINIIYYLFCNCKSLSENKRKQIIHIVSFDAQFNRVLNMCDLDVDRRNSGLKKYSGQGMKTDA